MIHQIEKKQIQYAAPKIAQWVYKYNFARVYGRQITIVFDGDMYKPTDITFGGPTL